MKWVFFFQWKPAGSGIRIIIITIIIIMIYYYFHTRLVLVLGTYNFKTFIPIWPWNCLHPRLIFGYYEADMDLCYLYLWRKVVCLFCFVLFCLYLWDPSNRDASDRMLVGLFGKLLRMLQIACLLVSLESSCWGGVWGVHYWLGFMVFGLAV